MVRLLQTLSKLPEILKSVFQSHNGAIAAVFEVYLMLRILKFQSHNGAIAALMLINSSTLISMFQSHNGAIAAIVLELIWGPQGTVSIPQWCDCCLLISMVKSVTIRVSIPQWCDCCEKAQEEGLTDIVGFNPTMVRLLLQLFRVQGDDVGGFNPTMVRLLPVIYKSGQRRTHQVSIPQWCDCCISSFLL